MRIGINIDGGTTLDELIDKVADAHRAGYASVWLPQNPGSQGRTQPSRRDRHQLFGYDSLTALAVAGREVDGIELGTCVVPTFGRHPLVLATQALTVQAAYSGPFTLGIGVSHRHVVEDQWGYPYDRTAHRMREFATVLDQVLTSGKATFSGETVQARGALPVPLGGRVPVLLAALGRRMLTVAGECADGAITWMTGRRTLQTHTVPVLTKAAESAGRPRPRVVASLPVCVTDDSDRARRLAQRTFLAYQSLPGYRAMLDRERVDHGGEIALIGTEDRITGMVRQLADIGVTDLNALVIGSAAERARAHALFPMLSEPPIEVAGKAPVERR